jgi:alpha-glucosidase
VLRAVAARRLHIEARVESTEINRCFLLFHAEPDERFFGFGAQFTFFDLRGRSVPVFVSEQGIGRGVQPLTWIMDLIAGSGGSWHSTYAPVPHFVSSHVRSLALLNSQYSQFDLRAADEVQITVFARSLKACVYAAPTPLELIHEHTAEAGRMEPLPDWIHSGVIAGMQGGTDRVRAVWNELRALDVPVAAFWLQDWVGQRTTAFGRQLWWNWELDRSHYPGWEELLAELGAAGVRVLTYINPFLVDVSGKKSHHRNLFREAERRGFLVRRADGAPYLLQVTTFPAGLLDLTNAEARDWMIRVIQENVLGVGANGWMADFGEGLPYDAVLANGDPKEFHNRYPVEWARLNRQAIEAAGRAGDVVFFTRSGFTESPRYSTLFWLGDQLVSWDRHDGMASAVTGLLSSGISGFAFQHADAGGYTTIDFPLLRYRRSEELLRRWMELSAFQVVFRTHEGNLPDANHQFYSNGSTLLHFRDCARLYMSWYEYRKELVRQASATGFPVVRHLFLHYPDDPKTWTIVNEEFLVGPDLLVAPVLRPRTNTVRVYLPEGRWAHLWSGTVYEGRGQFEIAAPLGRPAVFYRVGSHVGQEMTAKLRLR